MVFVKKNTDQKEQSFNVSVSLKTRRLVGGTVGLEIEVEGTKLPKAEVPLPWVYHQDGSLRGADNAEYVLDKPIDFDRVGPELENLWQQFREKGSILDDSNRTSVHVHLNVQSFFLNRLTSLMALYFVFEEVLTEWCGDHRVGNLFCLRAKDAPAIVSQIRKFIRSDMNSPLREHHHYAGLNTNAIHKFGSLEFRSLRGVSDPEIIKQWVSILQRLYDLSAEFTDPRDICNLFSAEGPQHFFETVLGDKASVVQKGISFSEDRIRESMYEGIRMAQDLCFAKDWSMFKPVDLSPDPFGRDAKKVMKKLQTNPGAAGVATQIYQQLFLNEGGGLELAGNPNPPQGLSTIATWAVDNDGLSPMNPFDEDEEI